MAFKAAAFTELYRSCAGASGPTLAANLDKNFTKIKALSPFAVRAHVFPPAHKDLLWSCLAPSQLQ
jgi:hypothetical protein